MPAILIVFYSRTGTTREVAQRLAKELGAETLAIQDIRPRRGLGGYLRSAWEAMRRTLPGISHTYASLAHYDLVVLGTPVWAGHASSPMRRFLSNNASHIRNAAFFCTMGGRGAKRAFREMQELMEQAPKATLALTQHDFEYGDDYREIAEYANRVARISRKLGIASAPSPEHGGPPDDSDHESKAGATQASRA